MTLTLPKRGLGESSGTPKTSELDYRGQNTLPWYVLHIIGKLSKCSVDVKNGLTWTIWTSTAQVIAKKKGSGVKLTVWLSTTKSRESTRSRCVQVECDTLLESSQGELQVCFRPHPNRRSEQRVTNSQNPGSLNRDSFGIRPGTKSYSDVGAAE